MNIKTILKSTGKWIALGMAFLFLCIGILFAAVQTETGKRYMAKSLQSIINAGAQRHVKIGRMGGFIPFDIQCDEVSVGDEKGDWLILKKILQLSIKLIGNSI